MSNQVLLLRQPKHYHRCNSWPPRVLPHVPEVLHFVEPEPGTTLPDEEGERCFFSELTEEQLMPSFCKVPKFRFVPCKVFLSYSNDDGKATPRRFRPSGGKFFTYDPPKDTAHTKVGSGRHQLFGSIQAAAFSLDPASPSFSIFNRNYNDPIVVPNLGFLSPHNICHCSIPFSTSVKIAAKLNVATDTVDAVDSYIDYDRRTVDGEEYNDAFEVCNDCAVVNFSDNKRYNGGSGSCTLKGRDGYLKLYYVALKYAVDAALEVEFESTSNETKVVGRVMAYYGKNFDYGSSPAEKDDYKAMLFETKQHEVKPGKLNLMRSVLSVPAQFPLIIDANLSDSTSGDIILSGVYEFFVPTDGSVSPGLIKGNNCTLKLKVDWKLPPLAEETTQAKRSYYSDLAKKQVYFEMPEHTPLTMDAEKEEKDDRWSLQEELSKLFYQAMAVTFLNPTAVPVSISPGTKADGCDYLCTSVLDIWPEARNVRNFEGPKHAGLMVDITAGCFPEIRMLKKIVVGGPGFLNFKLSGKWIATSIHKMLTRGIVTLAPKLPVKKTVINFLSRNVATEMRMDHIRSAIIGETLACVLEYSGVLVQRRFQYGDHLDIKSKMMMTELLIERFPNGEVDNQAIGELEVLYEESKKRFDKDAEFRKRAQQDWRDERHQNAWVRICKISQARYQKVYHRLGVSGKEEGKELYDQYIGDTRNLLMAKGLTTKSEGDETICIEGRKLPLVDLAAVWHALDMVDEANRIVHVTDVGQRDNIELCITVAKRLGLRVNEDPLSHVAFGFVQVKDYERFQTSSKAVNILNLLDEAKSHCREVLVGQGKAKKWTARELEHAAEALGYGAIKYAHLKNNRLTDYTLKFNKMFDDKDNTAVYVLYTYARICSSLKASSKNIKKFKVETLELKNGAERVLGLHLLRFTEVLGEVYRVLAPHIMCEYLYVLCKKFNDLNSSDWQVGGYVEESKLLLFEATKVVMGKCLDLLGITRIDKI